jgi:hypothetical protein
MYTIDESSRSIGHGTAGAHIVTLITQDKLKSLNHPRYRDFLNYTGLSFGARYTNIAKELTKLQNQDIEFINTETLLTGSNINKLQSLLKPFLKLLQENHCTPTLSVLSDESTAGTATSIIS